MKTSSLFGSIAAGAALILSGCAKTSVTAPPAPVASVKPASPETPAVQPPPPAPPATQSANQAKLNDLLAEVLKPIYFDYNQSDLKPSGKEILAKIGALLKQDRSLSITVAGNTDERGSTEYNQALGERRAHAAFTWLAAYGVRKDQLKTISYGKEQPVAQGHDEDSWSKNRRDEFTSKAM